MADQPQDSDSDSDNSSIGSEITYQEQVSKPPEINHALKYVLSVKNAFGDNAEDYLHFLALLKDFKANRITTPVVVSRLKLLFSEHQELIEGFNQFLPEEFKIALPLTRRHDISWERSISYLNKVKIAFSQEEERYRSFLILIADYKEAEMSLQELSEQMCELLSDRQDLLEEFFDFMPSRRETFERAAARSASITTMNRWKLTFLLGVALSVLVALGVGFAVRVGI